MRRFALVVLTVLLLVVPAGVARADPSFSITAAALHGPDEVLVVDLSWSGLPTGTLRVRVRITQGELGLEKLFRLGLPGSGTTQLKMYSDPPVEFSEGLVNWRVKIKGVGTRQGRRLPLTSCPEPPDC